MSDILTQYINNRKICNAMIKKMEHEDEDNVYLKQFLLYKKQYYNNKINELCNHQYISDLIDIDLDRSIHIQYCMVCETTKK